MDLSARNPRIITAMSGNLLKKAIQDSVKDALEAGRGEEQIRAWVDELLVNAIDHYPQMYRQNDHCPYSLP